MNYIDAFKQLDNFEHLLEVVVELEANLKLTTEQCKQLLEALRTIDY